MSNHASKNSERLRLIAATGWDDAETVLAVIELLPIMLTECGIPYDLALDRCADVNRLLVPLLDAATHRASLFPGLHKHDTESPDTE